VCMMRRGAVKGRRGAEKASVGDSKGGAEMNGTGSFVLEMGRVMYVSRGPLRTPSKRHLCPSQS
jgi:hypothetical protein